MQLPLLPALAPPPLALAQSDLTDRLNELGERVEVHIGSGEYAVGWFTLALINAGIAQGKNRSGLNWFLLSLLFGPFATFLLVAFFEKLSFYED